MYLQIGQKEYGYTYYFQPYVQISLGGYEGSGIEINVWIYNFFSRGCHNDILHQYSRWQWFQHIISFALILLWLKFTKEQI